METSYRAPEWAGAEYAHAELNDIRNVPRLVQIATRVAERPRPKVSEVFDCPRELQACYDFLENDRISTAAIVRASADATARKASSLPRVLIPCDGASLTFVDRDGARGTGSVGNRTKGGRGLQVMDAIALREDGTPLGLMAMEWWARPLTRDPRHSHLRPVAQREVCHWLSVRASVREAAERLCPETALVFLHDGGADAWPVLVDIPERSHEREVTVVRAAQNRGSYDGKRGRTYLWSLLSRAQDRWRVRQHIPPGHGRTARRAQLEISVRQVTLDVRRMPSKKRVAVTLWAIQVRERGRTPRGQERLEWVLLTNRPTPTLARAREVIGWYILRWRVEDHHKTWKKSGSEIERTQLRSLGAMGKWMAIHAAVSARALALTHQARTPEAAETPARKVFSESELTALRALRAAREMETPAKLSVAQAVLYVAILGGYLPRKEPPGPKIIRRGLERLCIAAAALDAIGAVGPPKKQQRSRRK